MIRVGLRFQTPGFAAEPALPLAARFLIQSIAVRLGSGLHYLRPTAASGVVIRQFHRLIVRGCCRFLPACVLAYQSPA